MFELQKTFENMCGIVGISSFTERGEKNALLLNNAIESLHHRGPDFQNSYHHYNTYLGHARLSIIDTSEKAHQPFIDSSKRYIISYNGEIYNYKELRNKLEKEGHSFSSESDTEVILKMYISYGKELLKQLNGFFAFSIYDKKRKLLFIARDRMGIKPLYYFKNEDQFCFASELKALLKLKIPKQIDPISFFTYLQLKYIPAPNTILQNVFKLEPGHFLEVKCYKPELNPIPEKYFEISYNEDKLQKITPENYSAAKKKVRNLLEDSVKKRLVADVPVGTFLSGGIDSSIISILANRTQQNIQSFSIGFKDNPYFDETEFAKSVAKKHKLNHHTFELSNDDLYQNLGRVLNNLDEPFADSSALPVFILSKKTKEFVKVVLSGDGADEIFSGYNKHMAEYVLRHKTLQKKIINNLSSFAKHLPSSRNNKLSNINRKILRFADGSKLSSKDRYWQWASNLNEEEANYLLKENIQYSDQRLSDNAYTYKKRKEYLLRSISKTGTINEILLSDSRMVLPDDMLKKVDSMSMANSLEVRTPYLDHRLVNYVFSLPLSFKMTGNVMKKILRESFSDILPSEIMNRSKKGFEVPLQDWFRNDLKSKIENDFLNPDLIAEQNLFNPEAIKSLKAKVFSNNPADSTNTIWSLIVFQNWWIKYFLSE